MQYNNSMTTYIYIIAGMAHIVSYSLVAVSHNVTATYAVAINEHLTLLAKSMSLRFLTCICNFVGARK